MASPRDNPTVIDIDLLRKVFYCTPESGKIYWSYRSEQIGNRNYDLGKWNNKNTNKEAFATKTANGYLQGTFQGNNLLAHRVLWAMAFGEWPEFIDHKNGNRSDNRLENLRNVSHGENMKNRSLSIRNKSGATGVYWYKNKWLVKIRAEGKLKHLGMFTDFEEAVATRKAAEFEYGYHTNNGMR